MKKKSRKKKKKHEVYRIRKKAKGRIEGGENVSPNGAEKGGGRQRSTFNANHPEAWITGHSQVQVGAVQEELSRDCLEPLLVG